MKEDIREITDYIFLKSNPQKVDLLIIFGTRHLKIFDKVYRLYKEKLVPKILVTGGTNRVTEKNEAKRIKKYLIKLGIKNKDIYLEERATNTLENVLFSKRTIENKIGFEQIKKIMIFVKHYHSRRALMTVKKHFPKSIKTFLVTYKIYNFDKNNWFKKELGKEKVLSEYNKIKKYLKKGDIKEIKKEKVDPSKSI